MKKGVLGGAQSMHIAILAMPLFTRKNVKFTAISHDYIILSTFPRKEIESSLVAHYIRNLKPSRISIGKFIYGRLKVYFNISENMEKSNVCDPGIQNALKRILEQPRVRKQKREAQEVELLQKAISCME